MTQAARNVILSIFASIALFLVVSTWVPSRGSLSGEEARVTNITPQRNTWHEVEITTASGMKLKCRTRRGWPLLGPSRCPLEQFEQLRDQPLSVMHDGKRPYEVIAGSRLVVDYSAHRKAQLIGVLLAALMLGMAVGVTKLPVR